MTSNLEEHNGESWLSYISRNLLIEIARRRENDFNIQILNMSLLPITPGAEHSAAIFRATINYQKQNVEKTQSVIVKLFSKTSIITTEMRVYAQLLPTFEGILRKVGDETTLGARCFHNITSHVKCLFLDDLTSHGFSALREGFLSLDEVKGVCIKLAKWHAISYKLGTENPKYFDQLSHPYSALPNLSDLCSFITHSITDFINQLDNEPTLLKFKPYFEALKPDLAQKYIASQKEYVENRKEGTMYVLANGDLSFENTLFKRNRKTGVLEDVMLIDFQAARMAPIAHDLLDLLYLLLSADMRLHKRDEILYYYFKNFVETLNQIGFQGRLPKITEFRAQIMQQKHYELCLLTTMNRGNDVRWLDDLNKTLSNLLHLGYFHD